MEITKEAARAYLKLVLETTPGIVARNARTYKFRTWLRQVGTNSLGGRNFLPPSSGTVVARGQGLTIVKTGRADFDLIDDTLLPMPLALGDKVDLVYYQPRRFDGSAADGSEDPAVSGCRSFMLTGSATRFPVRWPGRYLGIDEKVANAFTEIQSPYLRDLITQMETITVNAGARTLAGLVRDAGCTALTWVDPADADVIAHPPAMVATVATNKLVGTLTIQYDRAADTYTVSTAGRDSAGQLLDNVVRRMVHTCDLAEVLLELVDDQSWQTVEVKVVPKRGKKAAAAAAAL